MIRRPPRSTLFPSTPLSQSEHEWPVLPLALPLAATEDRVLISQSPAVMLFVDRARATKPDFDRSEEHTSELQSHLNLVCRLLLEKKKKPSHKTCLTALRSRH